MYWSSAGVPKTNCLKSDCMVGHNSFVQLVGWVVVCLVLVIVWLCEGLRVVLCWSRTVGHVLVQTQIGRVVGYAIGYSVIPPVVRKNHQEEVRLVVVLVRKFAFGRLVV